MDILDDVLKQAGLRSRLYGHRLLRGSTSLQFPCDKSLGFHLVTQGEAYIFREGATKPVRLGRGDLALMARGHDHILTTEAKKPARATMLSEFDILPKPNSDSREPSKLTVISGAYQFWHDPIHPLFAEIPEWYVLRSDEVEALGGYSMLVKLITDEILTPNIGSKKIIHNSLDSLFTLILRKVVHDNANKPETWSFAMANSQIRKAIDLFHSDYAKTWTIEDVASNVGLSRAGFSDKFKKSLGETPLQYLTKIRMQKAIELLQASEEKIENVALKVGYQDAFGFSKVFKKITGFSPKEFRQKNTAEQKATWRF